MLVMGSVEEAERNGVSGSRIVSGLRFSGSGTAFRSDDGG